MLYMKNQEIDVHVSDINEKCDKWKINQKKIHIHKLPRDSRFYLGSSICYA